jgi:hypothetical protein
MTFTNNASAQPRRIEFIYDATGVKLRKTVFVNNAETDRRDYINGIEYKGGTLDRFPHTEGSVVRNENGVFEHEYVIKDHLGNARVTYRDGINKVDNTGNTTYNDGTIPLVECLPRAKNARLVRVFNPACRVTSDCQNGRLVRVFNPIRTMYCVSRRA